MSINPEALDEYREVLGEEFAPFFIDLIDTFFASGPEFIQTLKDSLADGDDELFTRTAHTMKSNCKTFGAYDFAELAFDLEKLGNEKKLDDVPEKLTELENAYQQLVDDLEKLKASLGG